MSRLYGECRTLENRDTTVVLEGETRASLNNAQYAKDTKIYDFELYPEDKIAIVRYSEVFGKEESGTLMFGWMIFSVIAGHMESVICFLMFREI